MSLDENERARASLSTPSEWSLTDYSETPSRNGVAWSGVIRRSGTAVGQVHDAGVGGAIDFEWTSPRHAADFIAEEKVRYGEQPEPGSTFVQDIATFSQFAEVEAVIFFTDESDVSMGQIHSLDPSLTRARAKAVLTDPSGPWAAKNPRVLDKTRGAFVPAAEMAV